MREIVNGSKNDAYRVSSYELEEAIKLQYGLDVEIPTLLFPEDFMNDCFKEYAYKDTRWDKFCGSEELCVRQYLRDVFPQYESILVKISW